MVGVGSNLQAARRDWQACRAATRADRRTSIIPVIHRATLFARAAADMLAIARDALRAAQGDHEERAAAGDLFVADHRIHACG